MDTLTITVLATIGLAVLTPVDWLVAVAYYQAWRGGETIRYFAPILALIISVAATVTACLFVGISAIQLRLTGFGIVPPGVGLVIILAALTMPSLALVWLLHLLRSRS